ncbi:MAG: MFS transporter [Pseudomonadota bacterium]
MLRVPAFIRGHPELALFALLATASSGFGQTFFIAVFGDGIRNSLGIGHGLYGALYSGATITSALMLLHAGGWVDRWPLHRVTGLVMALLAAGCLVLWQSHHWLMLLPGFFLVRFAGQGLMAHVGLTTAGRYFDRQRGKVMALTAGGFPLAEALLPLGAALIITRLDWHSAWLVSALVIVLFLWPLLHILSRRAPLPPMGREDRDEGQVADMTRGQVLRDKGFYLLLPAALAVPFTVTAILFHQGAIAGERGWSLPLMAGAFSGYALGHLSMLLFAGSVVDRLGAQRALPWMLLPIAAAMAVLSLGHAEWIPALYLTLAGISQGGISTAGGALWPERYGVTHLGAVRALAQATMVVSTAASPVVFGVLLDWGVGVTALAGALAAAIAVAMCLAWMAPLSAGGVE